MTRHTIFLSHTQKLIQMYLCTPFGINESSNLLLSPICDVGKSAPLDPCASTYYNISQTCNVLVNETPRFGNKYAKFWDVV